MDNCSNQKIQISTLETYNMTPEEQRIAIAESVGWSHRTIGGNTYWWNEEFNKTLPPNDDGFRECPDYLNDLNAMHEVEGAMVSSQWMEFEWQLTQVIERQHSDAYLRHFINATAAQRAEAYLKTIGKWKD